MGVRAVRRYVDPSPRTQEQMARMTLYGTSQRKVRATATKEAARRGATAAQTGRRASDGRES